MTRQHSATGRPRRLSVPRPSEPVPPPPADPPLYRALMHSWASQGRTLPGRHDPEWVRLAAPPVVRGQFNAPRVPPGAGR
ncbi:hypothetical protein LK07_04965 [Streptomyces pluripotens]|uniref:Uncharacterized protein n=1 Tax=Streptomyces pluripotens TaxID=1355015 RepID=A0A221NU39_9ACTN|nr:hypothetical protein LK06_003880 [Streptomyces pluripotens]ASN23481.1 hypothetical protein LK07_04965 [Streptomyces pluripotens]